MDLRAALQPNRNKMGPLEECSNHVSTHSNGNRVARPELEQHLSTQRRFNSHTLFSASEAQRTFVAFQLALPMPENLLNLVKEWGKRYEVFGIRGFSGDG